jgi:hypothetical protein
MWFCHILSSNAISKYSVSLLVSTTTQQTHVPSNSTASSRNIMSDDLKKAILNIHVLRRCPPHLIIRNLRGGGVLKSLKKLSQPLVFVVGFVIFEPFFRFFLRIICVRFFLGYQSCSTQKSILYMVFKYIFQTSIEHKVNL